MSTEPEPALGEAIRRGGRAVLFSQCVSQAISLAVLATLYRVLGLEPYGLFAMIAPLLALVRVLIASGLDVVTVQQAELNSRQVSALFWVNQILGLAMTLAVAAAAPAVAWFYAAPELTLPTVAMAGTSSAFVLGMQHQALLQRRLRLAALAWLRTAALGLAGTAAIGVALLGGGVWALVAQQYVELAALALFAWIAEPWRPEFCIRGSGGRRLVRHGGHFTIGSLALFAVMNVDKVLVGRLLGKIPLALYSQAFALAMRPIHVLITPLTGVMLPALSRTAGDREHYDRLIFGFFRFILLVLLPAGVGLALVAPETMRLLGGGQWTAAGPILALLAPVIPFQASYQALSTVFASADRPGLLSKTALGGMIAMLAAFALGLYAGDLLAKPLYGMAAAYTLGMVAVCLTVGGIAFDAAGVRGRRGEGIVPLFAAVAAMAAVVGTARFLLLRFASLPDLPLLAIEIALGGATYFAALWFAGGGPKKRRPTVARP